MSSAHLIDRVLAGEARAVARAISKVEDGADGAFELLKAVFPHTGARPRRRHHGLAGRGQVNAG